MRILISIIALTVLISCKDDELTGNARLIFSGNNLENLEIDIYPDDVFILRNIAATTTTNITLPTGGSTEPG